MESRNPISTIICEAVWHREFVDEAAEAMKALVGLAVAHQDILTPFG
jgi:hypothetical protein